MRKSLCVLVALAGVSVPSLAFGSPITFSVGGNATIASIQATVDAFRTALGNPNNGNAAGTTGGRREINWDGGGATGNAVNAGSLTAFQNTRGALFSTAGTGFAQAPASGGTDGGLATLFGNATYGTTFSTFSPVRLFTAINSNVVDATFFVPGTNGLAPATVAGFGAVFTDVDLAGGTSLSFFDINNLLLGTFAVPVGTVPDGSLSFLGMIFDVGIARVRIVSGTGALGPNDNPLVGVDMVVMDDFLFSEPQAVPEPSSVWLLGAGALALAARRGLTRTRRGR